MSKLILTIVVLFFTVSSYSQHGTSAGNNLHDSLLFDGSEGKLNKSEEQCYIYVKKAKGTVIGTRIIWKEDEICGEKERYETYKQDQLNDGDYLKPGEEIATGSDGSIELKIQTDFSPNIGVIKMSSKSKIVIKDPCNPYSEVNLYNGKIYREEILSSGKPKFQIKTNRSSVSPKGTKFTVESNDNEDIIKVYDGSVEVQLKKYDDSDIKNNAEELKKLTEDYQSGKITMDELIKRSKELSEKVDKGVNDYKITVTVEAGYMVKAGGKLSDIAPIPADDDNWWSDENFK